MLDAVCGCQGWQGLSGGVGTRDTHSLQPCSGSLLTTGAVKLLSIRAVEHLFSPQCVKTAFFLCLVLRNV